MAGCSSFETPGQTTTDLRLCSDNCVPEPTPPTGGDDNGSQPEPIQSNPPQSWEDVNFIGDIEVEDSSSPLSFLNGGNFYIDVNTKKMILSFPMGRLLMGLPITISGKIKELAGAYIEIGTNFFTGKTEFRIQMPLEFIVGDGPQFSVRSLPNGDPLPMVPSGSLPSIKINKVLGSTPLYLYLGSGVIAAYIESSLAPNIAMTMPIPPDLSKTPIGVLATVPKQTDFKGGFYISINLPPSFADAIETLLPAPQ